MGKLRFHPLFVIYVFLCVYFGWFNAIFYYVVSVVLHEYGHYFVAKKLGYDMQEIVFGLYGAGVKTCESFSNKNEFKIAIAGPLVNLVLIVLIVVFWWVIPGTYLYTYDFFISNFMVMVFNLIPVYPLDGGRCLVSLLSHKYKKSKIVKLMSLISLVLGFALMVLFVVSLFIQVNLNLLFIGLFLFVNGIVCDRKYQYTKIFHVYKDKKKPQNVKIFRLKNFDKVEMLRCLSVDHYSLFIIGNDIHNIKTQDDLLLM